MKKFAVYDMDRTITRIATFTPFLVFAALRQPWRLVLLPLFFLAMIGYPLRILDRKALKQIGFRLILGRAPAAPWIKELAQAYAQRVVASNVYDEAKAQIAADKSDGAVLVMATASPDFYAGEIGALLGFDHVIGTVQHLQTDGAVSYRIASANCYAEEKRRRVESWLPVARDQAEIRFYSDHHSDKPMFEWADMPIAVNPNAKLQALAKSRGWKSVSYS
jgi:HAD superfamily hydrolase (TIGR01490 family)